MIIVYLLANGDVNEKLKDGEDGPSSIVPLYLVASTGLPEMAEPFCISGVGETIYIFEQP